MKQTEQPLTYTTKNCYTEGKLLKKSHIVQWESIISRTFKKSLC